MKKLLNLLFTLSIPVIAIALVYMALQPQQLGQSLSTQSSYRSSLNSTTTTLSDGATFTGTGERHRGEDVMVTVKTDAPGTLRMDFSHDGTNWDSSLAFDVAADSNEIHVLVKGDRYYRTRFTDDSDGDTQTYIRLQTEFGTFRKLTSPHNGTIQDDADVLVVRSIPGLIELAQGKYQGMSTINKFGSNSDIDTTSLPEDIWAVGGEYTFATTTEQLSCRSSDSNDTSAGTGARTVTINGLDGDYIATSSTVTLNGTSDVTTTQEFFRVNTARVATVGTGGENAGNITCDNSQAVTFLQMSAGTNSSQLGLYTVAASTTAYIPSIDIFNTRGGDSSSADVALMTSVNGGVLTQEDIYGASAGAGGSHRNYMVPKVFEAKTDILFRVLNVTQSNTRISIGFDIILESDN